MIETEILRKVVKFEENLEKRVFVRQFRTDRLLRTNISKIIH